MTIHKTSAPGFPILQKQIAAISDISDPRQDPPLSIRSLCQFPAMDGHKDPKGIVKKCVGVGMHGIQMKMDGRHDSCQKDQPRVRFFMIQ